MEVGRVEDCFLHFTRELRPVLYQEHSGRHTHTVGRLCRHAILAEAVPDRDGNSTFGSGLVDHITAVNKRPKQPRTAACPLFNRLDLGSASAARASSCNSFTMLLFAFLLFILFL